MTTTKTPKPSKPQMNLLRSLAGLEERQARMKPVVYKTCAARGWITAELGGELTSEGRAAAGIETAPVTAPPAEPLVLRWEEMTATPWG